MGLKSRLHTGVNSAARRLGLRIVPLESRYSSEGFLSWLLKEYRVNLVIDVGANYGQFASLVRKNGYKGQICSFEPIKRTFQELSAKTDSDPNWIGYNLALGSENQQLEINIDHEHSDLASALPKSDAPPERFGQWEQSSSEIEVVQMQRLDAIELTGPDANDRRIYLKSDTQGFDLKVLEGAGDVLENVVGIQIEAAVKHLYDGAPTMAESIAALAEYGFSPVAFFPVTTSQRGRSIPVLEFDVIACRTEYVL